MLNNMSTKAIVLSFILSIAGVAGANSLANTTTSAEMDFVIRNSVQNLQQTVQSHRALNWVVGDAGNYSLDMGFIKGTMVMIVREKTSEGYWIDQNIDLGFAGKQKVETLIDADTGEVKKIIANGEEQEIPENNTTVVEVTQDSITVPAGTFECLHVVLEDNDKKQSNVWINPNLIPVSGMLKQVAPTQFGQMTILLTSFKKN